MSWPCVADGAGYNTGIHLAAETQITRCYRSRVASLRLQFVDNFHRPHFRRAGNGAAGESRAQQIGGMKRVR